MRKTFVIIFFCCLAICSFAGDTLLINNVKIIAKTYNPIKVGDALTEKVKFFTSQNKKLLELIFKEYRGGCNSEAYQLGVYEQRDTFLIMYSYWIWAGDEPISPFGAMKEVYHLSKDGKLHKDSAFIFVETMRQNWTEADSSGVKLLFRSPKNLKEKALLKKYIQSVQKEYNAVFLVGKPGERLVKEAYKSIIKKHKSVEQDIKVRYRESGFGFRITWD